MHLFKMKNHVAILSGAFEHPPLLWTTTRVVALELALWPCHDTTMPWTLVGRALGSLWPPWALVGWALVGTPGHLWAGPLWAPGLL